MVSLLPKLAVAAGIAAILYQAFFKNFFFTILGLHRPLTPLSSFGMHCERILEPGLEACEDMWLHEESGLLYLACGNAESKTKWNPSVDSLDPAARYLNDRMAILDTRAKGPISSRLKWMDMVGFSGIHGDGTINLQGFDVHVVEEGEKPTLRMLLVNNRPFVDHDTGALKDATKMGANATIELFETTLGSTEMRFVKTFHDPAIRTPNQVAFMGPDAFVFTNDKSAIHGLRRQLDFIIGGGSVGYCNMETCHIGLATDFFYPNGLIRGADGLVYVPTIITGEIHVLSLDESSSSSTLPKLKRLKVLSTWYPIDNLSLDKRTGDIYAAVFPDIIKLSKSMKDHTVRPATAVLRIRRLPGEELVYEIEKVLEDDGSLLPGSTTAVHDSGVPERFYLAGVLSPFIAICERI